MPSGRSRNDVEPENPLPDPLKTAEELKLLALLAERFLVVFPGTLLNRSHSSETTRSALASTLGSMVTPDLLRCFQINNQLEIFGYSDWEVGWLRAFKNLSM